MKTSFAFLRGQLRIPQERHAAFSRRDKLLWLLMMALTAIALATLAWLAHEHEHARAQNALNVEARQALAELGLALVHNAQALRGLHLSNATAEQWPMHARPLLERHREWLQLDWLDDRMQPLASVTSPWHAPLAHFRQSMPSPVMDATAACATAARTGEAAYAPSRLIAQPGGMARQVMPLCVPMRGGYVVAAYSPQGMLDHMLDASYARRYQVSLAEPDGTRLATAGALKDGPARTLSFQRALDLPGATLMLRLDSRHAASLLGNKMTLLAAALSLALMGVLTLLACDHARRRHAEAALAEALAVRQAMEDSLMVGLRARDQQGRIVYANPAFCEMVDYDESELLGTGITAPYWPPELAEEYTQYQIKWLSGHWRKTEEGLQATYQRKDGTRFPVLVFDTPLVTQDGRHIGWMSVVLDVSEQRRIEQMTRDSQERLQATARLAAAGEMASHISHELNQPLAAISSYANGSLNLLQALAEPPGPQAALVADLRTALAGIARQAGRAGQIIRSVHLAVRRGNDQRVDVVPSALFEAVLPLVQLHAEHQNVPLEVDVPPDLPPVRCAQVMVEQVLLNLARNAIQSMSATPVEQRLLRLQASLLPAGDKVRFVVADHGSGIAPDVAARLFTPFFTTKREGMGLGLSVCRTVVEQHGGTLAHEANQPQGTVFTFILPVADEAQPLGGGGGL